MEDLDAIVDEHLTRHLVNHLRGLRLFETQRHPVGLFLQCAVDLEWQAEDIAEYLVDEGGQLDILDIQSDFRLLVVEYHLVCPVDHATHDGPGRAGSAAEASPRHRIRSLLPAVL
ncbi:hypothetical protein D3C85_1087950 [compost metagenome]